MNTCLLSFHRNCNLAHPIIYCPGLSPGVEVQPPSSTLSPASGVSPAGVSETSVKGESEGDGLRVEGKRRSHCKDPPLGLRTPTDNNSKTHTTLIRCTSGSALGPLSTHFMLAHSPRPVLSPSPLNRWGLTQRWLSLVGGLESPGSIAACRLAFWVPSVLSPRPRAASRYTCLWHLGC